MSVREMKSRTQASDISSALASGYRDLWRFAVASGLRLAECFLEWEQIDWEAETISVTQKATVATRFRSRAKCEPF